MKEWLRESMGSAAGEVVTPRGSAPYCASSAIGAIIDRANSTGANEQPMLSLWNLHRMMNERRMVQLADGRVGKIVRVDTTFPGSTTTVTIWTNSSEWNGPASGSGPASGPGISKVPLADIVGEVERRSA